LQLENVCRPELTHVCGFLGRCARTPGLARCPLGLTEGYQVLQYNRYLFLMLLYQVPGT
jgi:hypothetical protein